MPNLGKTQTGSLPTEATNAGRVASCKLATFDAKRCQLKLGTHFRHPRSRAVSTAQPVNTGVILDIRVHTAQKHGPCSR